MKRAIRRNRARAQGLEWSKTKQLRSEWPWAKRLKDRRKQVKRLKAIVERIHYVNRKRKQFEELAKAVK